MQKKLTNQIQEHRDDILYQLHKCNQCLPYACTVMVSTELISGMPVNFLIPMCMITSAVESTQGSNIAGNHQEQQ